MKNHRKGFTLVELVIAIAVIGILAAVLIPTFWLVIDKSHKTAAEQEADSLRVGISVEYQGTFEDYCTENKTGENGKKLSDKIIIGSEDGATFGDYISELKEGTAIEITDKSIVFVTKSGYQVTLTADESEIIKLI